MSAASAASIRVEDLLCQLESSGNPGDNELLQQSFKIIENELFDILSLRPRLARKKYRTNFFQSYSTT